jgi:pilus assembly protein Flp/PilA
VPFAGKRLLEQQAAFTIAYRCRHNRQPCRDFCHRKVPYQRIVKADLALPVAGTMIGGSEAMMIVKQLLRLWHDSRGATAIEYGLIASLIVIAMIAALRGVADENTGMWAWVERDVLAATR